MTIRKKMPAKLYQPHECELAIELWQRGFTPRQIAEAFVYEFPLDQGIGKRRGNLVHNAKRKAQNILKDVENWNPRMDEESIQSAFNCDLAAYDRLNHFERLELMERLYAVYKSGDEHPSFPGLGPNWMGQWCRAVDEDAKALSTRMTKRRKEGNLKAPRTFGPDGKPLTKDIQRAIAQEYERMIRNKIPGGKRALAAKYGMSQQSIRAVILTYEP
jgi:hypothetical protein